MKMSPKLLLQLRNMESEFQENHPKVYPFLDAAGDAIDEGSVIAIEVTTANGKKLCSNIRVNAKDMEMIRMLKGTKEPKESKELKEPHTT